MATTAKSSTPLITMTSNDLQSLIIFLHEQSSSVTLSHHNVRDFIQRLRHLAQLGVLDQPRVVYALTDLYKARDRNSINASMFQAVLEQIRTVSDAHAYDHLDINKLQTFLNAMVYEGDLTLGQAHYTLDRAIDLCRTEPITTHDIVSLLTVVQLEHNRQQPVYPRLIDGLEALTELYSSSFADLRSLERDIEKTLYTYPNNMKKLPDEIRRRLNEIVCLSKKFRNDRILREKLFEETIDGKILFDKIKDLLTTENFHRKKQSLSIIIQIHEHFLKISQTNTRTFLNDIQLDTILQTIQERCPKQEEKIQDSLRHMAEIGHLQDQPFVDYIIQQFPTVESKNGRQCFEVRVKLDEWPLTLDLNHPDVRPVLEHLIQIEAHDRIDLGTMIEIQNRLNQLARLGKWTTPLIKSLVDGIMKSHGKTHLADKIGYQLFQSYRSILNDLTHAIKFELYLQKLTSYHKLSDVWNRRWRHFLYKILHNELPLNDLVRLRSHLERLDHRQQLNDPPIDTDQIRVLIDLLPSDPIASFSITLTDKLLERLRWDGKTMDTTLRDHLLRLEHFGVLTNDIFEDIYNLLHRSPVNPIENLHTYIRTASLSNRIDEQHIFADLFDKLNELFDDGLIDLQQSIEIKEQMYLLERMKHFTDLSQMIIIKSRLINASNLIELRTILNELKNYVHYEQFRLSKAQTFIDEWPSNGGKKLERNSSKKQIIRLFTELADLNRLYDDSSLSIVKRYVDMKHVNPIVYRQLIKDLQRLKDHALLDKQATECIRSIEARLYKSNPSKQLDEFLLKELEKRLKHFLASLMHPIEQHLRVSIDKKLTELVEAYVQSNPIDSTLIKTSEELLENFDSYAMQIKQSQQRRSIGRDLSVPSNGILPKLSPSQQSLHRPQTDKINRPSTDMDYLGKKNSTDTSVINEA